MDRPFIGIDPIEIVLGASNMRPKALIKLVGVIKMLNVIRVRFLELDRMKVIIYKFPA